MKKIIIISLFLIFANITKGQEYFPFPTDSATWVYQYWSNPNKDASSQRSIMGDTLIHGLEFHKFGNSLSSIIYGYIHIDGKKVYYLSNNILYINQPEEIDTNIRLLYDFGIDVGDTLKYPYGLTNTTIREDSLLLILTSIDTITTNVDSRRKYNFRVLFVNSYDYTQSFTYWIEGIGEYHDLDFIRNQHYLMGGEFGAFLLCFFHNNQHVYGTYCTVKVDEFKVKDDIILYPNPFIDNFQINIPEDFSPYGYSIYDVNGKIIKSESISEFEKTISINANNFKKGTFFIVLSDEKGNMLKKVVVKN